jgi:hypothetical protein
LSLAFAHPREIQQLVSATRDKKTKRQNRQKLILFVGLALFLFAAHLGHQLTAKS